MTWRDRDFKWSNCRYGGNSKKKPAKLTTEPEDVTELPSHDKTLAGWGVASYGGAKKVDSQRIDPDEDV